MTFRLVCLQARTSGSLGTLGLIPSALGNANTPLLRTLCFALQQQIATNPFLQRTTRELSSRNVVPADATFFLLWSRSAVGGSPHTHSTSLVYTRTFRAQIGEHWPWFTGGSPGVSFGQTFYLFRLRHGPQPTQQQQQQQQTLLLFNAVRLVFVSGSVGFLLRARRFRSTSHHKANSNAHSNKRIATCYYYYCYCCYLLDLLPAASLSRDRVGLSNRVGLHNVCRLCS